jgi:hypothetical protein
MFPVRYESTPYFLVNFIIFYTIENYMHDLPSQFSALRFRASPKMNSVALVMKVNIVTCSSGNATVISEFSI